MAHAILTSQEIDDVLAGTFPASDPPAWTPGLARPAPEEGGRAASKRAAKAMPRQVAVEPTVLQMLASQAGVLGIVLLVPLAILAVGAPVALVARGLLEAGQWLVAMIR
jgi:hypothetical protein